MTRWWTRKTSIESSLQLSSTRLTHTKTDGTGCRTSEILNTKGSYAISISSLKKGCLRPIKSGNSKNNRKRWILRKISIRKRWSNALLAQGSTSRSKVFKMRHKNLTQSEILIFWNLKSFSYKKRIYRFSKRKILRKNSFQPKKSHWWTRFREKLTS